MFRFRFAPNRGTVLIFAAALAGSAVALWNYLAPGTGIDGTYGALLVLISSLLLALDAVILSFLPPGALRAIFLTLGALGVIGTLSAAWLLHAWWLIAAMVIVVIGLLASLFLNDSVHEERTA